MCAARARPSRIDQVDPFESATYRAPFRDSVKGSLTESRKGGRAGRGGLGDPATWGPSIGLGGATHGVSPLELASAYGVFATGGEHVAPRVIDRVTDRDGSARYEADPEPVRALDADVADAVAQMLADAVTRGTGRPAAVPGDGTAAGKTGTSRHGADAWFAGFTDELSVAVWVGHPDGRTPMAQGTGGRLAAPIWRDFVAAAQ